MVFLVQKTVIKTLWVSLNGTKVLSETAAEPLADPLADQFLYTVSKHKAQDLFIFNLISSLYDNLVSYSLTLSRLHSAAPKHDGPSFQIPPQHMQFQRISIMWEQH